jgi:hypothetical protein
MILQEDTHLDPGMGSEPLEQDQRAHTRRSVSSPGGPKRGSGPQAEDRRLRDKKL